jgi:hypothetical protein
MTEPAAPPKPRRRGRPCKDPPWLKQAAQMVGRGTPLRRALWSLNVQFSESQLKNIYRLKLFRQYYEEAKIALYREWGQIPRRRHTSPGERYLTARLDAMELEEYFRSS